jgi:two-component system response regulator CpxR
MRTIPAARIFSAREPKEFLRLKSAKHAVPLTRGAFGERPNMRPKKIILCVDDNEQTLSVRKFLLETRGYRVLSTTSAHEALEIVDSYAPGELSLLLCDLLMPQMDGLELIRRVREMQPGLPSLMVSGTVTSFERGSGADVFLPKGACSPVELLERVRVLVARKRGPKKQVQSAPAVAASAPLRTLVAA